MSLVIARKESKNIFFVGDTRLSDSDILPNATRPDRAQMVGDPRDSAVKITILNAQIALAFAGGAEFADEAIKRTRDQPLANIVKILQDSHVGSEKKVEYILAIGNPINDLITIKHGKTSYGQQNAWIGDPDAFNFYQETLYNLRQQDTKRVHDILYQSQNALKAVIESSKFETVNGFRITVSNQLGGFAYQQSVTVEVLPFTVSGTGSAGVAIGHGTSQAGGYTVNICPDARFPDILPIHILQGDLGIIYQVKDKGLLHPEILSDTDETEFTEILLSRFNISVPYRLSSPAKSYLARGVKALQKGNTSAAIVLFQKGLKEPNTDLKSLLNINMASAYFFSGEIAHALQFATEAIRLDPKNYQKWIQIMANGRPAPGKTT